MTSLAERYAAVLAQTPTQELRGRVLRVQGLSLAASGPAVGVGELCRIHSAKGVREALVTGFAHGETLLQPLDHLDGIRPGDRVVAAGCGLEVPVGPALVGRVVDALGRPLDGKGPIVGSVRRAVHAPPPPAYGRPPIDTIFETGQKAIDTLYTLGAGQRMGIFAGSGVGKSTLLGELAKHAQADMNVIVLIGERGREVAEFVDKILGPEGMRRSVVVVATSDRPAIERMVAAWAAHALAEHFRDAGASVLLMCDSLTRFCQAGREVGLASGEAPAMRGYPPSVFALLPRLLERAGKGPTGSITGIYSVLVEGDDENDPVADNARAVLDGHLFLSRAMAGRAIYPAIDPLLSVSRLAVDLASPEDFRLATRCRALWGEYERVRDLVEVGAYQKGADGRVDQAIALYPQLIEFVRQSLNEVVSRTEALGVLRGVLGAEA